MTELKSDQFEMRRLESLSNTIFGVAMTLLAYDLPRAAVFTSAPDWNDLARVYSGKLAGLALSFIIAGVFWISHHRRLARQPVGSRGAVILNLFFLLSIVLLPVTNGPLHQLRHEQCGRRALRPAPDCNRRPQCLAVVEDPGWLAPRDHGLAVSAAGVHPGHGRCGVRAASRAVRVVHRLRRAADPALLCRAHRDGQLGLPFIRRRASRRTRRPARKA
ncbi:hypothetical protein ACVWXM_007532 [Bradyrhizobium sp. GM7.3]